MKKARLTVYLDPPILDRLSTLAGRKNQSLSLIAEAAISASVNPEEPASVIIRRWARVERQIERSGRDTHITVETLTLFIWYWLANNPPLPEPSLIAAKASATERFDNFMEALGQRLAGGGRDCQ